MYIKVNADASGVLDAPALLLLLPVLPQVGFMMLYNFYAWPLNQRPRVAQV
jgi:hypothetical protein